VEIFRIISIINNFTGLILVKRNHKLHIINFFIILNSFHWDLFTETLLQNENENSLFTVLLDQDLQMQKENNNSKIFRMRNTASSIFRSTLKLCIEINFNFVDIN